MCTPHFNRKNELILFRGRKTVSAPEFWSPGWLRSFYAGLQAVPAAYRPLLILNTDARPAQTNQGLG